MSDLREELESAFETDEDQTDEELEPNEPEAVTDEPATDGIEDTEESTDTEEESTSEEEANPEEGSEETPSTKIGEGEGKEDSGINAPIGFSPESREKWKDVPGVVKEQIQKREKEIETAMRGTAEARRTHTHLSQLANSYAPILAAEGAETPIQAIEGLFKTVAELRVGSPQQTATKMAHLIKHYGVDISMLDQALAGEQVSSPEVNQMQQMLDQRLAPIQDMVNQQKQGQQQAQQQAQQQVNDELASFAEKAEFLNDVRYDMADLIDLASKQGRKMSFQEAYDKACSMNTSISKVLAERASAEALKNSGEKQASKKNASSSVRASSANTSGKTKDLSLEGEIRSIWDAYE